MGLSAQGGSPVNDFPWELVGVLALVVFLAMFGMAVGGIR